MLGFTSTSPFHSDVRRGTTPLARDAWAEGEPDLAQQLEAAYKTWLQNCAECEEKFRVHLYENDQFDDNDVRKHRMFLFGLLYLGEQLALQYMEAADVSESAQRAAAIDQKVAELTKVLYEWHGPADGSDLPESFRVGMAQLDAGQATSMDEFFKKL